MIVVQDRETEFRKGEFSASFSYDSGRKEYLVKMRGRMNNDRCQTHDSFHRAVLSNTSTKHPIVFDLSEVEYMDTSGIAEILFILRERRKSRARNILTGIPEKVKGLFDIYKFPYSRVEVIEQ